MLDHTMASSVYLIKEPLYTWVYCENLGIFEFECLSLINTVVIGLVTIWNSSLFSEFVGESKKNIEILLFIRLQNGTFLTLKCV